MDSNNDTQEITCKRCQDLNLREFNKAGHKSLNVTLGEVRLGALNRCIGCKLLANAVAHYSSRWAYLGLSEVNQVTITLDTLLSSLRFRVSIRWPSENGEESPIYLQILAENNDDIPFDGFDIAHPPASSPTSSNCLACIKDWLDSCDADHEDCKPDALSPFQKPRRLLRLEKGEVDPVVTLVDAQGIDSTYTAVSHCWGSTNIPKTTSMCVDQYMLEGLPFSILTKTFRDAIDVTLRLQIQYIWIDSLCIVQDDRQDWMNECPKMGNIYGGAYLVIAATVAEDGALGFYTDRPPFYRFRFETSNGFCVRAVVRDYIRHDSLDFATQFGTQPILPLLTRAWTLQEHLLATKIVHFMPAEVVWECRSSIKCECGDFQDPSGPAIYTGPGKRFKSKYHEIARWGSRSERLKFWAGISIHYSARKITFPSDRLPALSSIARHFDRPGILGRYLAGLWEESLPRSLLWWSFYSPEESKDKRTHWRDLTCSAPTWSWLSIEGRVTFPGFVTESTLAATVLRVSYTLETNDLYGPVSNATLKVSGVMAEVQITFNEQPNKGPKNFNTSIRRIGTTDSVGARFDTNPFEFTPDDIDNSTVVVLQVYSNDFWGGHRGVESRCIMMKLVATTYHTYERLGVSRCPDEWFKGKDPESLILR